METVPVASLGDERIAMSFNESILVLGAGELGLAVVRALVHQAQHDGHYKDFTPDVHSELENVHQQSSQSGKTSITVLLRSSTIHSKDPRKEQEIGELRALGVRLLPGDLVASSAADLAIVFSEFQTVIGCTGFIAGRNIQLKLAHAALDAGVKRYFPWQFGVDYDVIGKGSAQDLFDEQLEVRELLRSQNRTEWVIVSTGMFTSFLFEPAFGVVDVSGNTVRALGTWDTAVTVTTADDIGTLTAAIVFSNHPRFVDCVVYTAGDTLTYGQLADLVDSVLGRKLQRVEWTVPMLQMELSKDPTNALKKYRVVFAQGRGVSWDVTKSFNHERQIAVENAENWARRNLK